MSRISWHKREIWVINVWVRDSNPVTKKQSKHIDIHYHYIREVVEWKFAEIFFINGDKNPADLLTKNLGSDKFQLFRPEYGLHFDAHAHHNKV